MATIVWLIIAAVITIIFFGMVGSAASMKSVNNDASHSGEKSIPLTIYVSSEEEKLPEEIKPSEPLMTESEFAELKKCVVQLRTMISKLSREQHLAEMINEKSAQAGGDRMPDHAYFRQLLKIVFIKDLKHCYEKMGRLFRISTYTAEGQCLLLITDFLNEESSVLCEYHKFQKALNPIDKPVMLAAIKYLSKLMSERINISVEGDEEFAFSAMLINFDEDGDYLGQYRSVLRQLITGISGIYRNVQAKENEWIDQIKNI